MKKRLLIVEDETDLAFLLKERARHEQFECAVDTTGAHALNLASSFKPHAVLLDMNLPKISGLGIIRELKAQEKLAHIPVIVLSAINQKEVVSEAMDLGANAYFTKGGTLDDLFTTVHDYVLEQHVD